MGLIKVHTSSLWCRFSVIQTPDIIFDIIRTIFSDRTELMTLFSGFHSQSPWIVMWPLCVKLVLQNISEEIREEIQPELLPVWAGRPGMVVPIFKKVDWRVCSSYLMQTPWKCSLHCRFCTGTSARILKGSMCFTEFWGILWSVKRKERNSSIIVLCLLIVNCVLSNYSVFVHRYI